jgi:hypothetical protein
MTYTEYTERRIERTLHYLSKTAEATQTIRLVNPFGYRRRLNTRSLFLSPHEQISASGYKSRCSYEIPGKEEEEEEEDMDVL